MKKYLLFAAGLALVLNVNAVSRKQVDKVANNNVVVKAVNAKEKAPAMNQKAQEFQGVKGKVAAPQRASRAADPFIQPAYKAPNGTTFPGYIYEYEDGQYSLSQGSNLEANIPGYVPTTWTNASYVIGDSLSNYNFSWQSCYLGLDDEGTLTLLDGPTEGESIELPGSPAGYYIYSPYITMENESASSEWSVAPWEEYQGNYYATLKIGGQNYVNFSDIGTQPMTHAQYNFINRQGTRFTELPLYDGTNVARFGYSNFDLGNGTPIGYANCQQAAFAQILPSNGALFGISHVMLPMLVFDGYTIVSPQINVKICEFTRDEDGFIIPTKLLASGYVNTDEAALEGGYWNNVYIPIIEKDEDGIESESFVNVDKDVLVVIDGFNPNEDYCRPDLLMSGVLCGPSEDNPDAWDVDPLLLASDKLGVFGLMIMDKDEEGNYTITTDNFVFMPFDMYSSFFVLQYPEETEYGVGYGSQLTGFNFNYIGANTSWLSLDDADEDYYKYSTSSSSAAEVDFDFMPAYDLMDAKYSGEGCYEWIYPNPGDYDEETGIQTLTVEIDALPEGVAGRRGELVVEIPGAKQVIEIIQGDYNAIHDVVAPVVDKNAAMYNVLGRRVDNNYKGIVIQNGHKFYNK